MKTAYPVILVKDEKLIVVHVPDFGISTQGKDYADAIYMARDAISLVGVDMVDDGETIPEPSAVEDIVPENGGIVTLVDVDFDDYRRKLDMRSVKKNCTIPSWLNYEAERAGINFSQVLQDGLKAYLGVQ